jgi:hypothetical protein
VTSQSGLVSILRVKGPVRDMWELREGHSFGAPSNRYSLKFFGLEEAGVRLRARAQTVDNLRENSFACGKPDFTNIILPITAMTS